MEIFVTLLELVGTVSFAVSGTMVGLKKHMDIFGVCVLGLVTACGGGVLREATDEVSSPEIVTPLPSGLSYKRKDKSGGVFAWTDTRSLPPTARRYAAF